MLVANPASDFTFWLEKDRRGHIKAVWSAVELAYSYLEQGRDNLYLGVEAVARAEAAEAAGAAARAEAAARDQSHAAEYIAGAAARAVYAFYAHAAAEAARVAAAAAYAAYAAYVVADADAEAAARAAYADCWSSGLQNDIELLQSNAGHLLADGPLWHESLPKPMAKLNSNLERALKALGLDELWQQYLQWQNGGIDSNGTAGRAAMRHRYRAKAQALSNEAAPEQDLLDRRPLAEAMAALLDHPQQSEFYTVALLGNWGEGKLAVLGFVKNELGVEEESENARHQFIWAEFDAWGHEHSENIAAAIAQEVVTKVREQLGLRRSLPVRLLFNWRERLLALPGVLMSSFIAASLVWLALNVLGNLFDGESGSPKFLERLSTLALTDFLFFLGVFIAFLWWQWDKYGNHPMMAFVRRVLQLPSYSQHLGLVSDIREQLGEFLKRSLRKPSDESGAMAKANKKPERLVLVIEDLDRCSPETIGKVLDATRIVAGQPNVVVILAADYRILLPAIASRFEPQKGKVTAVQHAAARQTARDYLAKLIQLPITLRPTEPTQLSGFVAGLFDGAGQFAEGEYELLDTSDSDVEKEAPQALLSPTNEGREDVTGKIGVSEADDFALPTESQSIEEAEKPADVAEIADVLLQSTLQEQQLFQQLVETYGFSNPRQLKRLHNTFLLLRQLLATGEKVKTVEPAENSSDQHYADFSNVSQPVLCNLFWLEYLNALPTETGKQQPQSCAADIEANVWQGKAPTFEIALPAEQLQTDAAENRQRLEAYQQQIAAFVLPSAELSTPDAEL